MSAQSNKTSFIHLDLDGLWTLPACYGYAQSDEFIRDPVFSDGIERCLALLSETGTVATIFVVGRDLELAEKAAGVARFVAAGHRLANHSYDHQLALGDQSDAEIDAQLERTQQLLERLGGVRPLGFRAPGYGSTPALLAAVARAGLVYDGSHFPSPLAGVLRHLMRRIRRRVAREGAADPAGLRLVYGGGESGPGRNAPFVQSLPGGELWRLPVAVTPTWGVPLQASLAIRLGPDRVLRAFEALARRGAPFTWLLHGMDFLGPEDLAGRLPRPLERAYAIPARRRIEFMRRVLRGLQSIAPTMPAEDWVLQQAAKGPQ